jgi:hypothetical protein
MLFDSFIIIIVITVLVNHVCLIYNHAVCLYVLHCKILHCIGINGGEYEKCS